MKYLQEFFFTYIKSYVHLVFQLDPRTRMKTLYYLIVWYNKQTKPKGKQARDGVHYASDCANTE